MTSWDAELTARVVHAYRGFFTGSSGDRAERALATEQHWWAWQLVSDECHAGTLPVAVLDALVHDPAGDAEYRSYVGAGPVEDALTYHAVTYASAIDELCRTHDAWADAAGSVWLSRAAWEALPTALQRLVPEPARHADPTRTQKARSVRGARP